jgi:glycosyltransferase involved in cell wall biosynthesis
MTKKNIVQPLVAVITPVYNGFPFLERTLACVQDQTYANIVHVVLDNASTDNTPDVIRKAARGQVPIITERNTTLLRQVKNWNAAIAMTPSAAKYVKVLCADDLMRHDCIERLVAVAEEDPAISVVVAVDVFDDHVKPHGMDRGCHIFDGAEVARSLLANRLPWMPFHHVFFRATPARLKDPFPDVEGAFDADFFYRLLQEGKLGLVSDPLFYTRYHAGTVTSNLVSEGKHLCQELDVLIRNGSKFTPPEQLELWRRAVIRKILRHLLIGRVRGQSKKVEGIYAGLARSNVHPNTLDFVEAVLTWPLHRVRKWLRSVAAGLVTPPVKVTEQQFTSEVAEFGRNGRSKSAIGAVKHAYSPAVSPSGAYGAGSAPHSPIREPGVDDERTRSHLT